MSTGRGPEGDRPSHQAPRTARPRTTLCPTRREPHAGRGSAEEQPSQHCLSTPTPRPRPPWEVWPRAQAKPEGRTESPASRPGDGVAGLVPASPGCTTPRCLSRPRPTLGPSRWLTAGGVEQKSVRGISALRKSDWFQARSRDAKAAGAGGRLLPEQGSARSLGHVGRARGPEAAPAVQRRQFGDQT